MFNEAVLTKKGIALNNKVQAGSATIEYLRVGLGKGIYEKNEKLEDQERLKEEKQNIPISSIKIIDEKTVKLRVVINNEGIIEGYDITEIGLYATDPDEGEILYSVAIATEGKMDYQPSKTEVIDYQITIDLYSTVSNTNNATIKLDMGAVASADDLIQLKEDMSKGDISETVIETLDTIEDKYPVPAAGENVKRFFGKVLTFLRNIRPLTGDITLYVSANAGSDTTGDGSQLKPFKTIQHAIDIVPKDLGGHECIIKVAPGTYAEQLKIDGFNHGVLRIYGSENSLSDDYKIINVLISGNTSYVFITGFRITTTTGIGVSGYNNTAIILMYLKIVDNALSIGPSAIYLAECQFNISNCHVAYHNAALTTYRSYGFSSTWTAGTGNNCGLWSYMGSTIKKIGQQPQGSVSEHCETGGSIFSENGTQIYGLSDSIACTWGTFYGAYYRHGNLNGVAQIVIQLRVTLTASLTAGISYYVTGFPAPILQTFSTIAVATSLPQETRNCLLDPSGKLIFMPQNNMASGVTILFNCTYMTNA